MKGSGIIGAYHTLRVALLVRRVLPLHMMAPGVALDGTVLAEGAFSPSEVVQRIKEAMEPSKDTAGVVLDFMYLVPGHPPMWSEPRFVEFVSFLSPCLSFHLKLDEDKITIYQNCGARRDIKLL